MHQFAFAGFGTAGNYVNRGSKRYRLCKCQKCGKTFHPKKAERIKFCSRKCFFEAHSQGLAAKSGRKKKLREPPESRKCRRCAAVLDKPRVIVCDKCRKPAYTPKPRVISSCIGCGASIYGTAAKKHCAECLKKSKKVYLTTSGLKAAHRKARKLKLRGVTVEIVNEQHVLQRDGWRCQLCGVRTPQRLRGSYDDRAPEIDHIIPLALGGEHSYRNVQCTCRKCNLAKGFVARGQLRMFG